MSKTSKVMDGIRRSQKAKSEARFYNLNSIFGNQCMIYGICGARKTGKSYSATDFLCRQKKKLKDNVKNYWLRISETSTKALLSNKADKLVDPDLKRKYKLNLTTKGFEVYNILSNNKFQPFMTVVPLSQFGKLKGVGFYDKDFEGWYNIVLDEFQVEQGEKRTSFDILYNFIGMVENIIRTTKAKVRVILLGNTLQECCTIFKAMNFIPEKFGRYYLHKFNRYTGKRELYAVIDNIEPTEEYFKDRNGSFSDLLGGGDMSNFTNEIRKDLVLIRKGRTIKPTAIIKFTKSQQDWYTLWDGHIIKRYNKENLPSTTTFAMRPYLGDYYSTERRQTILDMYDAKAIHFNNLITQAYFEGELQKLRKN